MKKRFVRIISFTCDKECFQRIKEAIMNIFSVSEIERIGFGDLEPYWKIDGYGILEIEFLANDDQFEYIKLAFSDNWANDVTDNRWATLFCEDIRFMCMSEL